MNRLCSRSFVSFVLALGVGAMASCNIVAPAIYVARGLPKVPAMHTLEKERATVIFIDDMTSTLPRRVLRQAIAQRAEFELLQSKALTNMIEAASIQAAAARDTSERGTSIARLGKSVQADVVIYVWMESFGLTPDGATYQPFATARVKVIDVVSPDARVWPESFEGQLVSVTPKVRSNDVPTTAAAQAQAQEGLAAELGSAIARLFYESEPRESVTRFRPQ